MKYVLKTIYILKKNQSIHVYFVFSFLLSETMMKTEVS